MANSLFDPGVPGGRDNPIKSDLANSSIFDRAVVLSLSFHRLGVSKSVATSAVVSDEVEGAKDYLRISKEILKSEQLEAIKKHDGVTARLIRARSIPSLFRAGMYLVGLANVVEVDELLRLRINERQGPLLQAFMTQYEYQCSRAKSDLGSLYDPRDYPSRIVVESKFNIEYSFIEFGVPGRLAELNPALVDRESKKIAGLFQSALDEGVKLLRLQMSELVDHMIERLSPNPDGTKKVFRDSITQNVDDFLRLFQGNNLAGDQELQAFVDRARLLMKGIDANVLRNQDQVRDKVKAGFESIKAGVDTLLVDGPNRKFRADDWGDV